MRLPQVCHRPIVLKATMRGLIMSYSMDALIKTISIRVEYRSLRCLFRSTLAIIELMVLRNSRIGFECTCTLKPTTIIKANGTFVSCS